MKKVEKERKIKTLSLVALIVAVLGLTIAFAALSQTLTINGTASVDAAKWDIHFENLSEPVITGDAFEIMSPTMEGTSISNINVSLTKPGDSITYEFDVVNNGTVDAVFSNFVSTFPEDSSDFEAKYKINYDFDGDGVTSEEDLQNVQHIMEYKITYDGKTYSIADIDEINNALANQTLNKGETKHIIYKISYDPKATKLPVGKIKDGPISFGITYVQK